MNKNKTAENIAFLFVVVILVAIPILFIAYGDMRQNKQVKTCLDAGVEFERCYELVHGK